MIAIVKFLPSEATVREDDGTPVLDGPPDNERAASDDADRSEGSMAASDEADVSTLFASQPHWRGRWIGVVGLELPAGVAVHPSYEDAVITTIDDGAFAVIVDRYDGNFGFSWGFDAPSATAAEEHVKDTARNVGTTIGAAGVVELKLLHNKRLDEQPPAPLLSIAPRK